MGETSRFYPFVDVANYNGKLNNHGIKLTRAKIKTVYTQRF